MADPLTRRTCELSWRPPREKHGTIDYYEVALEGRVRELPVSSAALAGPHRPSSTDCGSPSGTHGRIQVSPADFMICKFAQLLPNRNYSATIWVVNEVGRSPPAAFQAQCLTDFGGPEHVATPQAKQGPNTTLALTFPRGPPDETNGPIMCYYVALMPLLDSAELGSLSAPKEVPIGAVESVVGNNLQQRGETELQMAYIAESYDALPTNSVLGDGHSLRDCSVIYRSRYKVSTSISPPFSLLRWLLQQEQQEFEVRAWVCASIYSLNPSPYLALTPILPFARQPGLRPRFSTAGD